MWRRAALALLLLLSCKRPSGIVGDDAVANTPTPTLIERYPIRAHIAWRERREKSGKVAFVQREESWVRDGAGWSVTTQTTPDDGATFTRTYVLGAKGLAYDGVSFGSGKSTPIDPPKVMLPAAAKPGQRWSTTHRMGSMSQERTCEVAVFDGCADGIVVTCTTKHESGSTTERTRWCGGVGKTWMEEIHEGPAGRESRTSGDVHDVP